MIFDEAKNLNFYKNLGIADRYEKAVGFLLNTDLNGLEPGKYEIDGKDVFANVFEYDTISMEDTKYEAHKNYTDIQYIIQGEEIMSYAPVTDLIVKIEYNPDKDIIYFTNDVSGTELLTKAGGFAIFHPWDGHRPKGMSQKASRVKKVVVKIREI